MVNKRQQYFVSFLPAISDRAKKRISEEMRRWWTTSRTDIDLQQIAERYNSRILGWINYYGRFYKSELIELFERLNMRLTIWVTKKFKRYRGHKRRAKEWLAKVACHKPDLFAHWKHGFLPALAVAIRQRRTE